MNVPGDSFVQVIVKVLNPPSGVEFAVQRGRSELLRPFEIQSGSPVFAFSLRLGRAPEGQDFNFLGEFAQGPISDRFVYINSGTRAGQHGSCWDRRAKLKLTTVPKSLVLAVINEPRRALYALLHGVAPDGGPICASVPPSAVLWEAAEGAV